MKNTNTCITEITLCPELLSAVPVTGNSFINFLAAGIIGATHGGLVNRTACADPTPGPVTSFLQALGNYSYVSSHPYSGISSIPAATIIHWNRLKFPHSNFKQLMNTCNALKVCILHIKKKLNLLTSLDSDS